MTRFSREEMIKFKLIHEAILGTSLYSECVIPQLLEENRILREGLNEITRRPKISDKEFHVMSHLDLIVRVKTVAMSRMRWRIVRRSSQNNTSAITAEMIIKF